MIKNYCNGIICIGLLFVFTSHKAPSCDIQFGKAVRIARVTGAPGAEEYLKNPNTSHINYNVGGTDLGIIWEMEKGRYGIFFGDTYGRHHFEEPVVKGSDWRCNVLAFSGDEKLEDGLTINNMAVDASGQACEIIYGGKDMSGNGNWTSIPTGAVRANGADYVHYMNVRHWESSNWGTNYSAFYRSDDNGVSWKPVPRVRFGEDSNFGQVGFSKKDSFVYMIGTESGRQSSPRLARFRQKDIEVQDRYEYWNGLKKEWVHDEEKATNLFEDATGELSFIYHEKSRQWLLLYFNETRAEISARYAPELTAVWSQPQCVAHRNEYPRLYGSYIHPLSAYSDHIYFLMSMWHPYNVFLMRTEIKYMTGL
jgi:hypothetical protein